MSLVSKSRIDKAGRTLALPKDELTEECLELEEVFDKYRESHLMPLTNFTTLIQNILNKRGDRYYIAQRLKRKPQIVRKLNRLSVRLTQLQDIGGLRIIVETNEEADGIAKAIDDELIGSDRFRVVRSTDYRPYGRDDSGYRALHKIIQFEGIYFPFIPLTHVS